MTPMKILVVDDDPLARLLAVDALREMHHEVGEYGSGADLLANLEDTPDLILLDIEMPGMDGIAACRQLRQAGDDHTQVVFVSSHDDLETRLAAYHAGGSDFIVKPYAPEELCEKVRVAEQTLARRQALASQAQYAQQAAFTAMSSMGEMGAVLEFLRASFACRDAGQLAQTLFTALANYGLHGLLEVRSPQGKTCFSSQGVCTPLEDSILRHAGSMERIFQFRDRMVINYPNVTLLVLDLPLDDPDRVGRLRDHLAILAEGADVRMQTIATEQQRLTQAEGIVQAVAELVETLTEVERGQARTRIDALEIDRQYLEKLIAAFVHLGLTDAQEQALAEMAQQTHMSLSALMDDDYSVTERLRSVTERLRALTRE